MPASGLKVKTLSFRCALLVSPSTPYVGYKEKFYTVVRRMETTSEHASRFTGSFSDAHLDISGPSLPSRHLANLLGKRYIAVSFLFPYSFLSNSIVYFLRSALHLPPHIDDHGGASLIFSLCHISLCSTCIESNYHECIGSGANLHRSSCSSICLSSAYSDWTVSLVCLS